MFAFYLFHSYAIFSTKIQNQPDLQQIQITFVPLHSPFRGQTLRKQKGSALYSINRQFKKYNEAQRTAHIKWVALLCVVQAFGDAFEYARGQPTFFAYKL